MIITDEQVKSAYNYAYALQRIYKFFDEDIVQEGMLRFVEVMQGTGKFNLALVSLKNRIRDCLRTKRHRDTKIRLVGDKQDVDNVMQAVGILVDVGVLEDKILFEQVYNLMLRESNQLEKELLEQYLSGYNFAEIARNLRITPGKARVRFYRMIESLKNKKSL